MLLEWTRTGLLAAGFVWVMFAWRAHDAPQRDVEDLIARRCGGQLGKDDPCELRMRLAGLGGMKVTGSVDVGGNVDVNGSVDVSR